MIAYLEGRIVEVDDISCVLVTTHGIGYEIFLPTHTRSSLPNRGEELQLYICHIVREDTEELFGFETWDERQTFIILTSISKVGARTALNILSTFRPDALRKCVLEEDVIALTQVSGIGKKTSQHIFLELKYKLQCDKNVFLPVSTEPEKQRLFLDVLTGLQGLGYTRDESTTVLKIVLQNEPDLDVSCALRACLKQLVKGS